MLRTARHARGRVPDPHRPHAGGLTWKHVASLHVVEREWLVWRRLWRGSVFSYVFAPLLFLAAMGIGLGDLVDEHQGSVQGFDYLEFITPGLMAASAAMQAAGESLWPVMGGVKWMRYVPGRGLDSDRVARRLPRAARVDGGAHGDVGHRVPRDRGVARRRAVVLGGVRDPGDRARRARRSPHRCRHGPSSERATRRSPSSCASSCSRCSCSRARSSRSAGLPDWLEPIALLSPLYHAVELCRAATTGSVESLDAGGNVIALLLFIGWGVWWGTRLPPGAVAVTSVPSSGWRALRCAHVDSPDRARRSRARRAPGGGAQHDRVPTAVVPVPHRSHRARAVPAVDRHRCRRRWSERCPGPAASWSTTRPFVAPGLMAAAAMNGAVLDTTFNFFFKFKYAHTFDAMLATPLRVRRRRATVR